MYSSVTCISLQNYEYTNATRRRYGPPLSSFIRATAACHADGQLNSVLLRLLALSPRALRDTITNDLDTPLLPTRGLVVVGAFLRLGRAKQKVHRAHCRFTLLRSGQLAFEGALPGMCQFVILCTYSKLVDVAYCRLSMRGVSRCGRHALFLYSHGSSFYLCLNCRI